jgi:5-methylcytosine-specific restriction endonuclease McrA
MPAQLRFEILKRDGFRCQYCGAAAPHALLEVDHVVPVSAGGTNDPVNLRTCCSRCNRGKGPRQLTELVLVTHLSAQLALDLRRFDSPGDDVHEPTGR